MIVGVGNILRGDDAFGPALIEKLKDKTHAFCIDAGSTPENYVGRVIKERPGTILIVDAAHLGREPGSWEILEKSEITRVGFTTHDLSPSLLIQYLERETEADIFLLGVQPVSVSMGEEMSEPITKALEQLEREILEALHA